MDPTLLLATSATGLLTYYLIEAGKAFSKKLGEKAGEATWNQLATVYTMVKGAFEGRPGGAEALSDLEYDPSDADNQAALRKELRKVLAVDHEFHTELEALLKQEQNERLLKQAGQSGIIILTGSGAVAQSDGTAAGAHGTAIRGNVGRLINKETDSSE